LGSDFESIQLFILLKVYLANIGPQDVSDLGRVFGYFVRNRKRFRGSRNIAKIFVVYYATGAA